MRILNSTNSRMQDKRFDLFFFVAISDIYGMFENSVRIQAVLRPYIDKTSFKCYPKTFKPQDKLDITIFNLPL